jgi:deoxycytidylate deaminase
MSLNNFYKLRKNFILLGLTGKMRSGSDLIVKQLSQEKLGEEQIGFLKTFQTTYKGISDSEASKIRRINDFFQYKKNWIKFDVLDYRNVLLLFILHHNYDKNPQIFAENISNWICKTGDYKDDFETPRFGGVIGIAKGSSEYLKSDFKDSLVKSLQELNYPLKGKDLFKSLKNSSDNFFFKKEYIDFANKFYENLDAYSPFLRHKLMHICAYYLRGFGTLEIDFIKKNKEDNGLKYIYIIADVINQLIKIHRQKSEGDNKVAHVIIDRLKNSYELMYFKEKYSGFYMIAAKCDELEREERIKKKYKNQEYLTDKEENLKLMADLDKTEYEVGDFKQGNFDGFDVENCVQKADYHTYLDKEQSDEVILEEYAEASKKVESKDPEIKLNKTNHFYVYQPIKLQILKLIALIQQPGLITPTYIERIMQIAHTTKLNSGCISRQVGAVVTDSSFSVKGIGWNDVPQGQTPCGNRDIRDLMDDDKKDFTPYELGDTEKKYDDDKSFNEKIKQDYNKSSKNLNDNLEGRPCSFCFKTFHNKYEGVDNQVHTRSLHAEENAMLQIAKNGGEGLHKGNLFTTASPCELCSKKAFQLGIKNIFFIDLYPGISKNHILEGGMKKKNNPNLYQYQGVIGRGYQKLYEPFMSIKDETVLRSNIKPSEDIKQKIKNLTKDKQQLELIEKILKDKDFREKASKI